MHLQVEIHLFGLTNLIDKEFIFRNGTLKEDALYLYAGHNCFLNTKLQKGSKNSVN